MRHIPQLIRLVYTLSSMYFVFKLLKLDPDTRSHAIELLNIFFGGVLTLGIVRDLVKTVDTSDDDVSD